LNASFFPKITSDNGPKITSSNLRIYNRQARQVLQEAVAIARQIKHAEFLSLALCFLGIAVGYLETYDQAVGYFQESLILVQQLSAPVLLFILLTTWGELRLFHSQFDAARQHFLEVLALDAEEQRYPEMLARAHDGLAHIALQEQKTREAREHAETSLRLFKQIGHYKTREVQAWIKTLPSEQILAVQEGMANSGR